MIGAYPVVFNSKVIDAHNQKGSVNRKYYSTILGNIAMDNHQWLISTRLSSLSTENDVMASMFQSDLIAAASLTAYQPIVVLEKSTFFQGEAIKGKIILGKS